MGTALVDDAPVTVRRPGRLLVLLGAMTAMAAFSMDMYLPAFPRIAAEFRVGESRVQLTLTACLLGLGLGQLLGGPLSDRWGRRRPAVAGLALYTFASLVCVVSPSAEALAAARLVQGLAAGTSVVVARAVIRDLYSGRAAAAYFSRLVLVFGVAPVVAPSVGGLVLRVSNWRGVFVVLAAIGAAVLLACALALPETLPPVRRQPGGVVSMLRGMRVLAGDRVYVGYVLTFGLMGAGLFSYLGSSSFVIEGLYGAPPQVYGLMIGANAAGFVVAGQLNAVLVHRFAPRRLLAVALTLQVTAALALLVAARFHSLPAVAVPLLLFLCGLGMALPNATALALDRHPERAGAAAALMGGSNSAGGATAAPLVGLGGSASAAPMAAAMAAVAGGALLVFAALTRRSSAE